MFPPTSRYFGIATVTYTAPDGTQYAYLSRRFLPAATTGTLIALHEVTQGERLDNITARYVGDPEQFWRVCDTNDAMNPNDLTSVIGRVLRVTLPQGG